MDDRNKALVSTLNTLLETCEDGVQGFQTAAEALQNSSTRDLFRQYARERPVAPRNCAPKSAVSAGRRKKAAVCPAQCTVAG